MTKRKPKSPPVGGHVSAEIERALKMGFPLESIEVMKYQLTVTQTPAGFVPATPMQPRRMVITGPALDSEVEAEENEATPEDIDRLGEELDRMKLDGGDS
jgi:hypothetical protein